MEAICTRSWVMLAGYAAVPTVERPAAVTDRPPSATLPVIGGRLLRPVDTGSYRLRHRAVIAVARYDHSRPALPTTVQHYSMLPRWRPARVHVRRFTNRFLLPTLKSSSYPRATPFLLIRSRLRHHCRQRRLQRWILYETGRARCVSVVTIDCERCTADV